MSDSKSVTAAPVQHSRVLKRARTGASPPRLGAQIRAAKSHRVRRRPGECVSLSLLGSASRVPGDHDHQVQCPQNERRSRQTSRSRPSPFRVLGSQRDGRMPQGPAPPGTSSAPVKLGQSTAVTPTRHCPGRRRLVAESLSGPPGAQAPGARAAGGRSEWPDLLRAVEEFLIHAVKSAFPARRGDARDSPDCLCGHLPLNQEIGESGELPPVWPDAEGDVRGLTLEPLHKSAPRAALKDSATLRTSRADRHATRRTGTRTPDSRTRACRPVAETAAWLIPIAPCSRRPSRSSLPYLTNWSSSAGAPRASSSQTQPPLASVPRRTSTRSST